MTKPTFKVQPNPASPGGICLTKEAAAKLGIYIQQLEAASDQ